MEDVRAPTWQDTGRLRGLEEFEDFCVQRLGSKKYRLE